MTVVTGLTNCSYRPSLRRIFLRHYLLQSTWQVLKFFWSVAYTILLMMFWLRSPTDRDIVRYMEGTVLGLLISRVSDQDDTYSLDVDECHLQGTLGKITSFHVVYTKRRRLDTESSRIISFVLNGTERYDRHLMMGVLFCYHSTSIHTKCHLFANSLTEYIIDNNLEILMPSTRTSLPLHHGLVHSAMSPVTESTGWYYYLVGRFYMHPSLRPSLLKEVKNISTLKGHANHILREEASPSIYIQYLKAARCDLKACMHHHNIPMHLLEALFNSTIVHSTDHGNYKLARFWCSFVIGDARCTKLNVFRTTCFNTLFAKPTLNPFFTNKICYMTNPFYREVYERFKSLDAQYGMSYADMITASIMY